MVAGMALAWHRLMGRVAASLIPVQSDSSSYWIQFILIPGQVQWYTYIYQERGFGSGAGRCWERWTKHCKDSASDPAIFVYIVVVHTGSSSYW